jgi:hypothetical protein
MHTKLILSIIFVLIYSGNLQALTSSDIYKKHGREIKQQPFSVHDKNLFVVVRFKNIKKNVKKRALFLKMEVKALKSILHRFAQYQFPDVNTAWFDIYFSETIKSPLTMRQALVVDKNIADGEAYLVLTIPQASVESYIPKIKVIKTAVNRAFDEGKLINLKKYLSLVEGERLRRVQETIKAKISKVEENKKKLLKNPEGKISKKNDQPTEPTEAITSKEQIKKPIECSLPLCKKMKTKGLNKDSAEKSINRKQLDKPFEGTNIQQSNELDDLL